METLVRTYFRDSGIVRRTQIDPYDEFVRSGMQDIIEKQSLQIGDGRGNHVTVVAQDVEYAKDAPELDAVLGMLDGTYACTLRIIFRIVVHYDGEQQTHDVIHSFCKFPVMVKSTLCKQRRDRREFDPGGYFVINGKHRVILPQEHKATNRVLVLRTKTGAKCVRVYSRNLDTNAVAPIEIRKNKNVLSVYHHFFGKQIKCVPLYSFLVAIGVPTQEAAQAVRCEEREDYDQTAALYEIGRCMRANIDHHGDELADRTAHSLCRMLQHVKPDQIKSYALYMVRKYWDDDAEVDEEDHVKCKRYETTNKLFYDMMAKLFGMFMKNLGKFINNLPKIDLNTLSAVATHILQSDKVTLKIMRSFSSGRWVIPGSSMMRNDVVEQLRRECFWAQLSQLLRSTVGSEGARKSKNAEMRGVHGSMFGYICVSFTQDGDKTGISKELGLFATYSKRVDPAPIVELIDNLKHTVPGNDVVIVDGVMLEIKVHGERLRQVLLEYRRRAQIAADVGFTFYNGTLDVRCDEGRILQPLVRVVHDSDQSWHLPLRVVREALPWAAYLGEVVDMLDADELSRHGLLATKPAEVDASTTHVMLHPIGILGPLAASVPFSNRNQAPRLTNYLSWMKQLAGPPIRAEPDWDTLSFRLRYAQRPLVATAIQKFLLPTTRDTPKRAELEDYACGVNVDVAIACHPNNQEDSIVVNKAAIDRGLLHVTSYHTYAVKVDPKKEQIVEPPGLDKSKDPHEYWRAGVLPKSTRIFPGQAFLFKRSVGKDQTNTSLKAGRAEEGFIDAVKHKVDDRGVHTISVRIRRERPPSTGDKICFRHGQKAVIGIIVNPEDMPYRVSDGTCPEILMNPHGFPTRMTMGYHFEMAAARCAAEEGEEYDGTAYECQFEFDDLLKKMHELGVPRTERMIDGRTGEMIEVCMMNAPIYAQRIKRFADDSGYARAKGPTELMTGQPAHGRERNGALRFGEMEKDCVVAHGATAFLQDRLKDNSDAVTLSVCRSCGRFKDVPKTPCGYCSSEDEYVENTRRAWVCATQELKALGIDVRFKL